MLGWKQPRTPSRPMPDFSDPTSVHPSEPEPLGATVVRPTSTEAAETIVRANSATAQPAESPTAQPVATSGSSGFSEETRQLLWKRLIVTHGAVGIVTTVVALLSLTGSPVIPCHAGLGMWAVVLPLLAVGQCVAGLAFL